MRITVISLLLATTLLCGCGVKPGAVDPPQGADHDYFPRTYPDPANDPDPYRYVRP